MLTFPQCSLGGDIQKWTSIMVAGPRGTQLQALGNLTCAHRGGHARVAEGRDAQGRSNAATSAAYPIGMAAFVMWALARSAVRAAACGSLIVPWAVGDLDASPPSDVASFIGAALAIACGEAQHARTAAVERSPDQPTANLWPNTARGP